MKRFETNPLKKVKKHRFLIKIIGDKIMNNENFNQLKEDVKNYIRESIEEQLNFYGHDLEYTHESIHLLEQIDYDTAGEACPDEYGELTDEQIEELEDFIIEVHDEKVQELIFQLEKEDEELKEKYQTKENLIKSLLKEDFNFDWNVEFQYGEFEFWSDIEYIDIRGEKLFLATTQKYSTGATVLFRYEDLNFRDIKILIQWT